MRDHGGIEYLQYKLDFLDNLKEDIVKYIDSEKENLNNQNNLGLTANSSAVEISDFGVQLQSYGGNESAFAHNPEYPSKALKENLNNQNDLGLTTNSEVVKTSGFDGQLQSYGGNEPAFSHSPENSQASEYRTNENAKAEELKTSIEELKTLIYELRNKQNQTQDEITAIQSNLNSKIAKNSVDDEASLRSKLLDLQEARMNLS